MPCGNRWYRNAVPPEDKSGLAVSYGCIAGIYKSQGHLDDALNWHQKSCVLFEQVVQERGTLKDKRKFADCNYEIADIYLELNRPDEARMLYQTNFAVKEQAVQEQGTPEDKMTLAVLCSNLAESCRAQGHLDEALDWYQKSCILSEQVLKERVLQKDQVDLAARYICIADIHAAQDHPEKALEFYQKAYEQTRWTDEWKMVLDCCMKIARILRQKENQTPQKEPTLLRIFKRKQAAPKESLKWIERGRTVLRKQREHIQTEADWQEYEQISDEFNKLW